MKHIYRIIFILILTACGIDKEGAPPLSSVNNAGELDISFNSYGYLTHHNAAGGNNNDQIFDIAVDSQDRIVAVGTSLNGSSNLDMVVYRITSAGVLDASFSGDGIFVHSDAAGTGTDIGYSVAIGPSDEIYVTGTSFNGSDFDMVTWKITSSGALDSSFAGTGVLVHHSAAGGNSHDQGNSIALDSTGKVIVAGYSSSGVGNKDMAVWKFTTAGVLDTSFSGDGIYTEDGSAGGTNEEAYAIKVDSADGLIVAGEAQAPGQGLDMALWKLTSVGALDTSFNGDGFFKHHDAAQGNSDDGARDVAIDAEGNFYISGFSRNIPGNNDMALWKVTSTGVLDTTFNSVGYTVFDVGTKIGVNTNDIANALLIDSQGRVVIAGTGNDDMAILRYLTDGNIDEEFNNDGFFSHDSAGGGFDVDVGTSLVEDSLNRVYIGGYSETDNGDYDSTFWRLK